MRPNLVTPARRAEGSRRQKRGSMRFRACRLCTASRVSQENLTRVRLAPGAGDVSITGNGPLNDILEVPVVSKRSEFVGHVAAEPFRLNGQLVAELGPAVNKNNDVVDIEAREDVTGAASRQAASL